MTLRLRFYFALLAAFVAIGLHLIAHELYLYWTMKWIDIPIHIIGGIMSGLFVLVGLQAGKLKESLIYTLIGVFMIGIAWEVLELYYKVAEVDFMYWLGTIKDLIDDCIGGLIAFYIWKKLPEPKQNI